MAVTVTLNRRMVDNTGTMFNPITSADAVYYKDDYTTVADVLENLETNSILKEGGVIQEDLWLASGKDVYIDGSNESITEKLQDLEDKIESVSNNNISYIGDLEITGDLTVNGDIEFIMDDYEAGEQREYDSDIYTLYKITDDGIYFRDTDYNIFLGNNVYVCDETYVYDEDRDMYTKDDKYYKVLLNITYLDEDVIILQQVDDTGTVNVFTVSYVTSSLKSKLDYLENQISSMDTIFYYTEDDSTYYMREEGRSMAADDFKYKDDGDDGNGTYVSVRDNIEDVYDKISKIEGIVKTTGSNSDTIDTLRKVYEFLEQYNTSSDLEEIIKNPSELNFGDVTIEPFEDDGSRGLYMYDSNSDETFLKIYTGDVGGDTIKYIEFGDGVKLDFELLKTTKMEDTETIIDDYFVKFSGDSDSGNTSKDLNIQCLSGEEYVDLGVKSDNTLYYIYDEVSTDLYDYTKV